MARILLVEDESMIAMFLEGVLQDAGYEVIGPMSRLESAMDAATTEMTIDAALLDVNLGRCMVYPVAEILAQRNIPLVFMTGYGTSGVPAHLSAARIITKPYTESMVLDTLASVLSQQSINIREAV